MALQAKAVEYFSTINSMANRLCVDLNEAMITNKDQLESLPVDEQQQLLNDTIVTPQVLMKYPQPEPDASPTKYAVKMIVDDHYSYRDEHSGPFSLHTASQRDLSASCVAKKKVVVKKVTPKYGNKPPKPAAPPPPVPVVKMVKTEVKTVISAQVDEDNEEVLRAEQIEINLNMNMRLDYDIDEDVVDSSGLASLIPKTGLDLLDNW